MEDLFVFDLDTAGTPFTRATQAGSVLGSEGVLFESEAATVLVDSGYGCTGPQLVERIAERLGDRPLDYILLTHSHYDHALGSAHCAARWPDVKIVASEYAARIFSKPGARATMREMDASAAGENGITTYEDRVDELRVDIPVADGDELSLNGIRVQAVALPGHTRCSFGYWFPESRLLLASESLGVFEGGDLITPTYLVSYQMMLESQIRAAKLQPEHLLIPHNGLLHGADCRAYLEKARWWLERSKDVILGELRAGKSDAETGQVFKEVFYLPRRHKAQPEAAFDLNTRYQVSLIRKEFM